MGTLEKHVRSPIRSAVKNTFCPFCKEPIAKGGPSLSRCTSGHTFLTRDGWVATHRHLKTGGIYRRLFVAKIEATLEPAVVYEAKDGTRWVRPQGEFEDGRFEELS